MKNSFSKRVLNMDASGVRKMFEMSQGMKSPIDLTVGQVDFSVPDSIKQEAIKSIESDKNKYTMTLGIDELRGSVANRLESKQYLNSKKENIIITGAVSGGLTLTFLSLFEDGDEIVVADPYFVSYKHLATLSGAKVVTVDTYPDFVIEEDDLRKAITDKTKAIVINSPANPTGRVYGRKEIDAVVRVAKEYDLFIVSDEIYEDFVYRDKYISPASEYAKTIVLSGFSKSHAMMGWRIGFMSAPENVIDQVMKIQQYAYVCAPTPFQYAAIKAIDVSISDEVERYKSNRDFLADKLANLYEFVIPEGAFYFFIKYPYEGEEFMKRCLENELLVVPGSVFSERNTHFRISFATDIKTLERGVEVLKKIAKAPLE